jgi:glycosyltransferase 2 family protein
MSIRNLIKLLGQLTVSIGLLYWAFSSVDLSVLLVLLGKVSVPSIVLLVVVNTVLLGIFQGLRWRLLLETLNVRVGFVWVFHVSLLAIFFNQIVPAMVGGEVARVWQGKKVGINFQTLLLSVMVDRIVGLIGIAFVCALGLKALFDLSQGSSVFWSDLLLVGLSFVGTLVIFLLRAMPTGLARWRVFRGLYSVGDMFWRIVRKPKFLIGTMALSVFSHAVQIFSMFFIAKVVELPLSVESGLILFPPILFVSMMPVSLAGWGVREGAMLVGLALVGINADSALAVSILFGALAICVGALSGGIWLVNILLQPQSGSTALK